MVEKQLSKKLGLKLINKMNLNPEQKEAVKKGFLEEFERVKKLSHEDLKNELNRNSIAPIIPYSNNIDNISSNNDNIRSLDVRKICMDDNIRN